MADKGVHKGLLRLYKEFNRDKFGNTLPLPAILQFSGRMSNIGGNCRWNHGHPIIRISKLHSKSQGIKFVKDALLHEMVHVWQFHAMGWSSDDSWEFRQKCSEVGAPLSFRAMDTDQTTYNYTYQCPSCKRLVGHHRLLKRDYSCRHCSGGRYNEAYKLVLVSSSKRPDLVAAVSDSGSEKNFNKGSR